MASPVIFRRQFRQLVPACDESIELITKLPQGKDVMVELKRARNPGHHRKFFKLLALVHESLPEHLEKRWPNTQSLRQELLIQTRNFDIHTTYGGATQLVPRSMAFASMSQADFEAFYTDCIRFICKHVISEMDEGVLREWIEDEVARFAA